MSFGNTDALSPIMRCSKDGYIMRSKTEDIPNKGYRHIYVCPLNHKYLKVDEAY